MRQFQGSLAPLQELGAERPSEARKTPFAATTSKRRASDRPQHYCIGEGIWWGVGLGSLLWIAALFVYAWMVSQ